MSQLPVKLVEILKLAVLEVSRIRVVPEPPAEF